MLKHRMTYTDFDGVERTEDFYFNLTKAECMTMELSAIGGGGMQKMMQSVIDAKDTKQLIAIFTDFIQLSYGKKSLDGKLFVKKVDGKPVVEEFMQTQAYSDLYMQLVTDSKFAADFINTVMPADLIEAAKKELAAQNGDASPAGSNILTL